ncbi:MAG: IMP cyclohydrolase [Desulfobulbaceae bacterium]|jgi:phosphoribosylaminoimidazolecarboxamide formyltransferase/IMP cyclohydrolase|nr:IMP cyclohydrolase [Desulfobulbaceae bacterium]
MKKIERALISLTDKTGVAAFAAELARLGVQLLSTGGTAKTLRQAGLAVTDVSTFTGFPEMLDGRVKTLHPKVHGGILYQRGNPAHEQQRAENQLEAIDLVAVNLYAFEQAVAKPGCSLADAIENIDIGGPTLLRAAAKNFRDVTVLVDPADYPVALAEIRARGNTSLATRFHLAKKVFARAAHYDAAISAWLERVDATNNPELQEQSC